MHTRYDSLFKYQCIQEYSSGKWSLRKLAQEKSIHFTTLQRWLKEYKGGDKRLIHEKVLECNKIPYRIVKALIKIKEASPNLTIREAQHILKDKGITLSVKKIWTIWRDWGYTGFHKKYISNMYIKSVYISEHSKMLTESLRKNKDQIPHNRLRKILQGLPVIGDEDFILQLNPKVLPLHHRLAQLYLSFGKKPLKELLPLTRELKNKLYKKNFIYSFLRANFAEIFLLDWMDCYEEEYQEIKNTERFYLNLHDTGLGFAFFMCKARCCLTLLKFDEAKRAIIICKNILKNLSNKPLALLSDMATFATVNGYITDAENWLNIMQKSEEHTQLGSFHMAKLACKFANGEFDEALKINERTKHIWGYESRKYLIMAQKELLSGSPELAIEYASEGLKLAQRENTLSHLFRNLLIILGAKYALRQKEEAEVSIRDYLPMFKKNKMETQILTLNCLIRKNFNLTDSNLTPPQRLLSMLCRASQGKKYYFKRAMDFAVKNKLFGNFLLYSLFFYELVNSYLARGKRLRLPLQYLKIPVFNESLPYYEILLLGSVKVIKNNISLPHLYLRPKEKALLTYLFLNDRWNLNVERVCENFWPNKENARHYLYQTISRIRKILKLPKSLLQIKESKIHIQFHFTTDWLKYNELTAQARALISANEYDLAIKKYKEAFKLFRGEPFKKNFDNWSVDMRFKILSQFETEAINFAKSCLEHSNKTDARKILQKVLRIIPDSQESQKILETL